MPRATYVTFALVALVALVALGLGACNDVRDYRGRWQGTRVGTAPELRVGAGQDASLAIDDVTATGLTARLAIPGVLAETTLTSLAGAEADTLVNLTYPGVGGAPFRVYLAFVAMDDREGDALVMVSLYDDRRVEVRVIRRGAAPIYAVFGLVERAPEGPP